MPAVGRLWPSDDDDDGDGDDGDDYGDDFYQSGWMRLMMMSMAFLSIRILKSSLS